MAEKEMAVVGLGTMGMNLARNLASHGVRVAVYNRTHRRTEEFMAAHGKEGDFAPAATFEELARVLKPPRAVLLMVNAGPPVDETIDALTKVLAKGDTIIDGGNSFFQDTRRRAAAVEKMGLGFIGSGVSGGEEGALHGPSLMPCGTRQSYAHIEDMFNAIAAKVDGVPCCTYIGPDGAGHFVKMVHNGIEYGLMAAYAEGLNLLAHADAGRTSAAADAETAPLSDPRFYQYRLDIAAIAELWRHGSIIASRLLDLTAAALAQDPGLGSFAGHVADSGEGRWTLQAAIDEGVPVPVISAALFGRFESRGLTEYADKLLSAMRYEFGGHIEKTGK